MRFGSIMQDLECYVDNSLRFNMAGHIVGRNAGVKGWLCDPERTDEAATLRSWREKYERTITVRRKDSWWERLKMKRWRKRTDRGAAKKTA